MERDIRAVWFVLLLNVVITLAWQVRSEWLGLVLAVLTWALMPGRLGRVIAIGMAGLAVFGVLALADIRLPGRNGEVSISDNLARVIAPINLELAKELDPRAKYHADTAEWRELWWREIWRSAHSSLTLEAFGHGFGFPLVSLAPAGGVHGYGEAIRTPHSVFYYALGYTGWVGVVVFSLFQFAIVRLLWRSYRLTGEAVGLAWWVLGMGRFFFEEGLGTPDEGDPLLPAVGHDHGACFAANGTVESNYRPGKAGFSWSRSGGTGRGTRALTEAAGRS